MLTFLPENLGSKIIPEPNSGCWLWTASDSRGGYGKYCVWDGSCHNTYAAHRYVFERLKGKIPTGMVLDHKCRTKCCVNPDHLECVTQKENVRRGRLSSIAGSHNRRKTHCKRGHEFTKENTITVPTGRQCFACVNVRKLELKQRRTGLFL